MAIGFNYRCTQCRYEWVLFRNPYALGPVQWGETCYTCFTCLASLSIAAVVDANSWNVWFRNHQGKLKKNDRLMRLVEVIDSQLGTGQRLMPITLKFDSVNCPSCGDLMFTAPLGSHLMKCPECHTHTGESNDQGRIDVY